MKKIEAPTLEEAYSLAALEFGCSVTELDVEVARQPAPGVFGLFRKTAIVYASKKERQAYPYAPQENRPVQTDAPIAAAPQNRETFSEKTSEAPQVVRAAPPPLQPQKPVKREIKSDRFEKPTLKPSVADRLINGAFADDFAQSPSASTDDKKARQKSAAPRPKPFVNRGENFGSLNASLDKIIQKSQDHKRSCREIETSLRDLFSHTCYKIDAIEVTMHDENVVRVFFDGEDAALLIGKDGYRYKALSYILFNWINPTYGYLLRLEIAEFLQNQEEMIARYLEPVISLIEDHGKGQTRILDGVLVQIALKELRARFPDKYVGIKTAQDGEGKYVVVNDFIRRYER
jgi:spoIIIJ-associated protein